LAAAVGRIGEAQDPPITPQAIFKTIKLALKDIMLEPLEQVMELANTKRSLASSTARSDHAPVASFLLAEERETRHLQSGVLTDHNRTN
jgi:hypothetical protein